MWLIIIIILVLLILILFYNSSHLEHYADLIPYGYFWRISKCYDLDCVKKESYRCYQYCNNIDEQGAQQNCRMKCMDFSQIQNMALREPNRDFNYLLPQFQKISLASKNSDYFLL